MTHFRKKILAAGLASAMMLSLGACGTSGDTDETQSQTAGQAPEGETAASGGWKRTDRLCRGGAG
ncbi:MAG: hypothetical protein KHZ73_07265 [Lachnospiraceae bacterium]|nr:hypothetical protein [Lachnospiraceae bacterium]